MYKNYIQSETEKLHVPKKWLKIKKKPTKLTFTKNKNGEIDEEMSIRYNGDKAELSLLL